MWFYLGIIAIVATFVNIGMYFFGKDNRFATVVALALTALTICAEQSMISQWIAARDWSAIEDVVPTLAKASWVLVGISIVLNSIPLLLMKTKNR